MSEKVIYEKHPVSPERKAELRQKGYKIIDAQPHPQAFERATLDHVGQLGVTLPFLDTRLPGATVVAAEVTRHEGQPGHPRGGEVVGIAGHPGFFLLLDELADTDVAERIHRCAADIGQPRLAIKHLVAGTDRMPGMRIRQLPAVQVVVVGAAMGGTAVAAPEVAQVGGQHPAGQRQVMHQACEVLAIEAVEPGVEVAQAQRLAHRIIGTDVGEITGRVAAVAIQVQAGAVRGVAQLELVQVTGGEAQPIDVGAGQLRALVSLRQQPRVVVDQHRGLGQQGAVLDHGLAQARLGGQAGAAEFVRGPTVVVHRQQAAAAATASGVQPHAHQGQGIEPNAQGALGEPGLVVEQKALRPLGPLMLGRGRRAWGQALLVTEVLVEIDVAQLQLELAVVDESASAGNGQPAAEQATGGPTENTSEHDRYSVVVLG